MKNKKYRDLMVTPAFLEARRRKHEHDSSYGRIIPVSQIKEAEKLSSETRERERPKTWSQSSCRYDGIKQSRKGRKNSQEHTVLPPTSAESQRVIKSAKEKVIPPGSHFQSWKIPERVISAEIIVKRKIPQNLVPPKEGKISPELTIPKFQERDSRKSLRRITNQDYQQLPKIEQLTRKQSIPEEVFQKDAKERAKEWLETSDRKEKKIAEKFFNAIADKDKETETIMPNESSDISIKKLSTATRSSTGNSWSTRSWKDLGNSCVHKTSSVAWRRDSAWLKPTKTFHQTWHGLKVYPANNKDLNISAMFMNPHKRFDPTFNIHPEWGCKA